MPIPTFTGLGPEPTYADVVKKINTVVKELQNLMLSLDTTNILEVDGDVLVSGTVTAGKIAAGAVTADKINVNELSAISANLGHITAGLIEAVQIFGSYIATAQAGVYPRAEMSNSGRLFAVGASSTNGVEIRSVGSNSLSDLRFSNGGQFASISMPSSVAGLYLTNGSGNLTFEFNNIYLRGFNSVQVINWDQLKNEQTGESLTNAFSEFGVNLAFDEVTRNLKMYNRDGDMIAQVNIPVS